MTSIKKRNNKIAKRNFKKSESWLSDLANIIKQITELKPEDATRMLQSLTRDVQQGNIIPKAINAGNQLQSLIDAKLGRSYQSRIPVKYEGDSSGADSIMGYFAQTLPSNLPTVQDDFVRNPFERIGYTSIKNQKPLLNINNPYYQDIDYLLQNLALDPRSNLLRTALGLGVAGVAGYTQFQEKENKNNEKTKYPFHPKENTPAYQQYLNSTKPSSYYDSVRQKTPITYQTMESNIQNRPRQETMTDFENTQYKIHDKMFGDKNNAGAIKQSYTDAIVEGYLDLLSNSQLSPEEIEDVKNKTIDYYRPFIQSQVGSGEDIDNIYTLIDNNAKSLIQDKVNQQLDLYRKNVLGNRTDQELTPNELTNLNGIRQMVQQNELDKYNSTQYIKDVAWTMSNDVNPAIAHSVYDAYKQFAQEKAKDKYATMRAYTIPDEIISERPWWNWFRTIETIKPGRTGQYYVYPAEEDKKIKEMAGYKNMIPKKIIDEKNQKKYMQDFSKSITPKKTRRLSQTQSHDIIQKSLAPKYTTIAQNKYLKEK